MVVLDSLENLWLFFNFFDFWVEYVVKGVGIYSSVFVGSINGDFFIFWIVKLGIFMVVLVVMVVVVKLNCLEYEDSFIDIFGKLQIFSE